MIEARSIHKRIQYHAVLTDISLTCADGGIFGILGPNGAGKTTIMKILMNKMLPDSGVVLYDGEPVKEGDNSRIGYLSSIRGLYTNVKINEMLLFLASLTSGDTDYALNNLDAWLTRFDLMNWKNKTVETFSTGMTQKIHFIAAVLHNPQYIFLDEPFAGLDSSSLTMIKEAIVDLSGKGKNIIISTHNLEVADEICSDILILERGKELLSGSMINLKKKCALKSIYMEYGGILDTGRIAKLVSSSKLMEGAVRMELAEGIEPEMLLYVLLESVSIRKFEILSPSLRAIYNDKAEKNEA